MMWPRCRAAAALRRRDRDRAAVDQQVALGRDLGLGRAGHASSETRDVAFGQLLADSSSASRVALEMTDAVAAPRRVGSRPGSRGLGLAAPSSGRLASSAADGAGSRPQQEFMVCLRLSCNVATQCRHHCSRQRHGRRPRRCGADRAAADGAHANGCAADIADVEVRRSRCCRRRRRRRRSAVRRARAARCRLRRRARCGGH